MTATLPEARYTEPEPQYETITVMKAVTDLRRGDNIGLGYSIGQVIIGHKYVTVKDHLGHQIHRELIETACTNEWEVLVQRETDESRAATLRYDCNMSIIRELGKYQARLDRRKATFQENWDTWGTLRYDNLGGMIEEEADHQLWAGFESNLEHHLAQGLDHVGALALYVEQLKDTVLKGYRVKGFSQSSNHLSSLMELAYTERMVEFIREARWFLPRD